MKVKVAIIGKGNVGGALGRGLRGAGYGVRPVDAGPVTNARSLEALGYFNIQLGYMLKMGPEIGFKLIRG